MLCSFFPILGAIAMMVGSGTFSLADEDFAPYGTAKVDMHEYPKINTVFDINYDNPKDLNVLYSFVRNTSKPLKGSVAVVTHGPELRAFAEENYERYTGEMDRMAELASQGVEFRMCNNALRAAGYEPEDMHGFVTVVPAGFPKSLGFSIRDTRL